MAIIELDFEQKGMSSTLIEFTQLGDSILEHCLKNNINLHHNCGGVCACSTCHVYVLEGAEFLPEISEKEENFIDRAISPRLESRLACQCTIDAPTAKIKLRLPDQSQFLGE
ncbi:MAG: 2Fe-2S iron-sulfur cluster-binding protein [Alphaproteobacteria bacterium]|nr:2Fe-2S iron-sulfur cluster-binding protein [Alphaproteobacteria bacterium]